MYKFIICLFLGLIIGCSSSSVPEKTSLLNFDYSLALEKAKQENKKLLLIFYADWCGPCKQFKATINGSTRIQEALKKDYLYYRINTDTEKEMSKKFKVSGIPASFILDASGKTLKNQSGSQSEKEFLDWLK